MFLDCGGIDYWSFGGGAMVAVLFARNDSIYKQFPNCNVWDAERNALLWPGGLPVIAHPPCRAWGRLRHFARPVPGEKDLALWAVEQVRMYGGILEHPYKSTLWAKANLPHPGTRDEYGGWTLTLPQFWFGHRAEKATHFYIVGCEPKDLPEIPLKLGEPSHVVQSRKREGHRPHISKAEREQTPFEMACWLVSVAEKCKPSAQRQGKRELIEPMSGNNGKVKAKLDELLDAGVHPHQVIIGHGIYCRCDDCEVLRCVPTTKKKE